LTTPIIAIVGGGPAGLMAAESAAGSGAEIYLFETMPSVGRKFLMAGKSGLNLTHAEPFDDLMGRFGPSREWLEPFLSAFGPAELRDWASGLGVDTFVGSSGRVFPVDFKAAPLLRAWVRRLRRSGVRFHTRHRWGGWAADGALLFDGPDGPVRIAAGATVLALGGGSWPRLGSDGAWVGLLRDRGVQVEPLRPANCGFDVGWTAHFRERFAGQPVKPAILTFGEARFQGEFVVTETGVEGSAVYRHSAALRDRIEAAGEAVLFVDLVPGRDAARLAADLGKPRGARTLAEHLRRTAGIAGVKAGLLRECLSGEVLADPVRLAAGIKALPIRLRAARPIAETISSAGGIARDALDDHLMIRRLPGTFCAGEMLDWEATTGGYLLTACFALGRAAGRSAAEFLRQNNSVNQSD
jgi:hypothetical protein